MVKNSRIVTHDGGKEITLLDLATHAAGFPGNPDNMAGATVKEQYETYTVEKMYAFLSGYTSRRDPGTEFEYSNVGMALLGHVIALRTGTEGDEHSGVDQREIPDFRLMDLGPLKINDLRFTFVTEMTLQYVASAWLKRRPVA